MIKLDPTKMYYLSHPCTSFGTMAENKQHENICYVSILCDQVGTANLSSVGKNELKIVRPLALIPETMEFDEAMNRCIQLLSVCDGIIMCGDWWRSEGCEIEAFRAKKNGLEILYYEDVTK